MALQLSPPTCALDSGVETVWSALSSYRQCPAGLLGRFCGRLPSPSCPGSGAWRLSGGTWCSGTFPHLGLFVAEAPRLPSSFTSIIAPFPAWGESFPLTPNTESAELDRLNTTTTRVGMRLNSRPDSKTSHFQKGRKTESRRPITRKAPIHRSRRAPRNKAPRDHHSHHAPQSREPRMRPKSPAADWAPT